MHTLSSASSAVRRPTGNGVVVSVPGINGANLIANWHAIGTASGRRWAGMRQLWIGLGSAFEVISVEAVEVSLTPPFLPWSGAEVEQKQAHVAPGFGRCK